MTDVLPKKLSTRYQRLLL